MKRNDYRARAAVADIANGLRNAIIGLRELDLDSHADALGELGAELATKVAPLVTKEVLQSHKADIETYYGKEFSGLSDFILTETRP